MADFGAVETIVYALKARLYLEDGRRIDIAEDDISIYSPNTSMSSQCIPLGAAAATAYTLTFNNQLYGLTADDMDNAKVHGSVLEDETWKDFGVWYVEDMNVSEQDPFCTISGTDALNSRFDDLWTDTPADYPRSLRLIAQTVCAVAGVRLATPNFHNADYGFAAMPNWGEDCTIRDVISYIAVCASGFARINYSGDLEIQTIGASPKHSANADYYSTYAAGGRFKFNCLQYQFETGADEEEAEYTRFAIDESIEDNATNTIQMSGNPLITAEMANDIAQTLNGVAYEGATIAWFGGADVLPGDELILTTTDGNAHRLILTSHAMDLRGGMNANSVCDMPSTISQTQYFSNGPNAFNPDGSINANAIPGLDKKVVSAAVGYFTNLTTENIKTSRLTAAIIDAVNIWAQEIDTQDIETDRLTATIANIMEASIQKLAAGTITTDSLTAAVAEILALKVGSFTASDITTDRLAAALAAFTVISAGNADFDLASIKNLLANALILQEGIANSMQIVNLAITSANIMSATLGELVLKGEDGKYYHVFVGSDGTISTEEATVSEDEITAGQTTTGKQIVETTANIADLNAQTIKAQSAIIASIFTDALTAGKITAGQALISSATIPELYTTSVNALGDSMTFSANTLIQFMLGISNNVNAWFRFTDDAALEIGRDDSAYYTSTDNEGFHVNQRGVGRIGSFAKRTLRTDNLSINNSGLTMKKSSKGGIRFVRSD